MKVGLSSSSSDMFDWNDEEISNIIWGGAEEGSDHVVPYPEGDDENGHVNLLKQESSVIKLDENKFLSGKLDFHLIRPESSSASSRNAGVSSSGMNSWPDASSSYNARMEDAPLVNEVLNDSSLNNKYFSKGIGPQDEELADFAVCSWENIGSFDDLDRMFSNQEPIFASVTLDDSDKMWSACKYTTECPPKSFSLHSSSSFMSSGILSETTENMEVKLKYGEQDRQSHDLSFEKMDDPASLASQLKTKISDVKKGGGGESKSLEVEAKGHSTSSAVVAKNTLIPDELADKVCVQKSLQNGQKRFKENKKGKSLLSVQTPSFTDVNSTKHSKNELSLSPSQRFLSSYCKQSQVVEPGPGTLSYNHISNSYITLPFLDYANAAEERPQTSNNESGECQADPGYEMTSNNIDSVGKPLIMVPQENVAELRRRRQMQAMLAIQWQLQQLGNPVSHDLNVRICAVESPSWLLHGCNDEFDYVGACPSVDVSSCNEQDDSPVLSAAANGYSAVETVLHRLHEVVSKLDSALRISIRDSLFRLAKSAVQRQQTSGASASPIGGELPQIATEDESDVNKREVKVTDVETDTNPTDRAVAHLLFHRPMENATKNPETPESSISAKLIVERQAQGGVHLQKLEPGKSSETGLAFSTQDLGSPRRQTMDCMDTSDNGPEYITLEGGVMEVVSSQ